VHEKCSTSDPAKAKPASVVGLMLVLRSDVAAALLGVVVVAGLRWLGIEDLLTRAQSPPLPALGRCVGEFPVTPAQAGAQEHWFPACAGMTGVSSPDPVALSLPFQRHLFLAPPKQNRRPLRTAGFDFCNRT